MPPFWIFDYPSMKTFEFLKDASDLKRFSYSLNFNNLSDLNSNSLSKKCFFVLLLFFSVPVYLLSRKENVWIVNEIAFPVLVYTKKTVGNRLKAEYRASSYWGLGLKSSNCCISINCNITFVFCWNSCPIKMLRAFGSSFNILLDTNFNKIRMRCCNVRNTTLAWF